MKEFVARKPEPTLGFSLVVVVPTGQYSNEKLINLGTNRWAFKPEFGLSFPKGRWTFEAAAGVWLFLDNKHTYPGENVRSQDPLYTVQAHVGYTVKPGLWIAADGTYYAGGKTYTNDVPGDTRQANSRAGLTASVSARERPLHQGVRLARGRREDRFPVQLVRNRLPVPLAQPTLSPRHRSRRGSHRIRPRRISKGAQHMKRILTAPSPRLVLAAGCSTLEISTTTTRPSISRSTRRSRYQRHRRHQGPPLGQADRERPLGHAHRQGSQAGRERRRRVARRARPPLEADPDQHVQHRLGLRLRLVRYGGGGG